jgi:hypothetical protein
MHRLPGFDFPTRKAELIAFSSLGAVALSLIGFAVNDAVRFAQARDCIASNLAPDLFQLNAADLLARSQSNHLFINSTRGTVADDPPSPGTQARPNRRAKSVFPGDFSIARQPHRSEVE